MPTALVSGWHQPAPMSAQTYKDLCSLIHQHSRIHLPPSKHTLLSSRLGKRLRELRLNSWEDYLNCLHDRPDEEIETLIDLVSTNHTHFFRENEHFDMVSTQLLNELLLHSPTAREKLHCWSAASSSGEEAFTLAIVLSEYAAQKAGRSTAPTSPAEPSTERDKRCIRSIDWVYPSHPCYTNIFKKAAALSKGIAKSKTNFEAKFTFTA
jgi:CheR methyltransferase, all-alpha domain/CheR methyltransferase, SAM binding domain